MRACGAFKLNCFISLLSLSLSFRYVCVYILCKDWRKFTKSDDENIFSEVIPFSRQLDKSSFPFCVHMFKNSKQQRLTFRHINSLRVIYINTYTLLTLS